MNVDIGLSTILKVLKQRLYRTVKKWRSQKWSSSVVEAATSNVLLSIWQEAKNTFTFKRSSFFFFSIWPQMTAKRSVLVKAMQNSPLSANSEMISNKSSKKKRIDRLKPYLIWAIINLNKTVKRIGICVIVGINENGFDDVLFLNDCQKPYFCYNTDLTIQIIAL